MTNLQQKYELENSQQHCSEEDPFTLKRYEQFLHFFPNNATDILDVGCNTGRGGLLLHKLNSSLKIHGLDCVEQRLHSLPECYTNRIYGLSTDIPVSDRSYDAVVAGEFLEHLYPADVSQTLAEFQRVLKIGGRIILTTPNPNYIRHKLTKSSVYCTSHLTQHYPKILKLRLQMHGFSNIKILGSGKMSQYLGQKIPLMSLYGSYMIKGDKY